MLTCLSGLFWAVWRRCFGEGKFKEVLSRTCQEIVALCILFLTFFIGWNIENVAICLAVSLCLFIFYWIQAVGCILDAGLNPIQNRDNYDKWYKGIANWICASINWLCEKIGINYHMHKYYGAYDWVFSSTRNFFACLPGILFYHSWLWLILIFDMYPIYLFCYWLYKKFPGLYKNNWLNKYYITEAKDLAEVLHGFVFGLCIYNI